MYQSQSSSILFQPPLPALLSCNVHELNEENIGDYLRDVGEFKYALYIYNRTS